MFYPKSLDILRKGIPAAAREFGISENEALAQFHAVLTLTAKYTDRGTLPLNAERGDIIITCELCHDDQWWQQNYGVLWQAAQWWHCGPFGLDCP